MNNLSLSRNLIPPHSHVLCAVSGGADSVCLLHALYRLRREVDFTLTAAHYNHHLRGEESDRDEAFVRQFTALCCGPDRVYSPDGSVRTLPAVELIVGGGNVARESLRTRQGVEETARAMRYAFLRETAEAVGADRIATAHNANDNAETVLLHLVRGSGLRGLGGIVPERDGLIRPLLAVSRKEIEAYLRFWGLPWREDSSNRSDAYARNRLRHRVLPELEDIRPGLLGRLNDMSARLRADEAYLTGQAEVVLSRLRETPEGLMLPAADLGNLPEPLAVRGARLLLTRLRGGDDRCTASHLEGLIELCRRGGPAARLDLPGGVTARRVYGDLLLSKTPAPARLESIPLALPGEIRSGLWQISCAAEAYAGQLQGPLEFWLARERIPALVLRPRQTGDELRLPGRPGKSLKKWYIDEKIPAHLRDALPVLAQGKRVAAAAGLGPDTAYLPAPGEAAWHIQCTPVPPEGT